MKYSEVQAMRKTASPKYTLQRGDNPAVLDKRFGFKPGTVAGLNPGLDYSRLQIGQQLNMPDTWSPNADKPATLPPPPPPPTPPAIPSTPPEAPDAPDTPSYYTIARGDTMQGLDKRFGLPIGSFEKANPDLDYRKLRIGQRINMPARQTEAPAADQSPDTPSPQSTTTPVVQFTGDQRFYDAIQAAETGSMWNPWIRTRHAPKGGSSAYGPVQITGLKAADYIQRFPEHMRGIVQFYNQTMAPMYANFLKYGREPNKPGYDRRWDYGGYGQRLTPEQQAQYRQMGLSMMAADEQEARRLLPQGTPAQLLLKRIQLWRGVPYSKDPRYYNTVLNHYRNSEPEE